MWLAYFPLTQTFLLEVGSEKHIASQCRRIMVDHSTGGEGQQDGPTGPVVSSQNTAVSRNLTWPSSWVKISYY